MDILKQIKEILEQQKPQEKEHQLEQLSDIFTSYLELNEIVIVEGVQLLLTAALQEKLYSVKEAFFYTINSAIVHHQDKKVGSMVDWEPLVTVLPSLEKQLQDYAFNILSLSKQEKYLHVLDWYIHCSDLEVRIWAQEARDDLRDELARVSNAQKDK